LSRDAVAIRRLGHGLPQRDGRWSEDVVPLGATILTPTLEQLQSDPDEALPVALIDNIIKAAPAAISVARLELRCVWTQRHIG